jgi:hypothetical protein
MVSMIDYQSSNISRSKKIMAKYPEQSDVRVYYDPSDPSRGVLEPQSIGGSCMIIIIGFFFIVVCGLVILMQNITLAPMM